MSEVILHITAGKGPQECRWVVAGLARAFAREAKGMGMECELLDGTEELPFSILLRIGGDAASAFAAPRIGTNQWIGTSPFRPAHKRRNWFVGVALAPEPEAISDFREEDIDYQAMRASGPGGQHVNKTDSAVRGTHPIAAARLSRWVGFRRRFPRRPAAEQLSNAKGGVREGGSVGCRRSGRGRR